MVLRIVVPLTPITALMRLWLKAVMASWYGGNNCISMPFLSKLNP
jgi:hypothetical protein